MKKTLKVGVTGGIGSGKSTICKVFEVLGIPVYNSDNRAKWLMSNDQALQSKLIIAFGDEVIKDGRLNRDYLASQVFGNRSKLEKLNSIVHPVVSNDFDYWYAEHLGYPFVIKEAALLIETGIYKSLDKLIVVIADKSQRMNRILERDSFRREDEIVKIFESQSSDSEKIKLADFVIYNNDSDMIIPKVLEIYNQLAQ